MPLEWEVTAQKVGNSLQVVIPAPAARGLRIKPGDKLALTVTDTEIVIRKAKG